MLRRSVFAALLLACVVLPLHSQANAPELWREVEIIRTSHGVPHIRAENLRAAGYALAWLQLEDYGPRTAMELLASAGRKGMVFGRDSVGSDFLARRAHDRAAAGFPQLEQGTRDFYDGFARGLNRYIAQHRAEFPPAMPTDFTAVDVLAGDVEPPAYAAARRLVANLQGGRAERAAARRAPGEASDADGAVDDNVGSNVWAFAPSRTTAGKAILMRNPHLAWNAGYYEAHLTVPGVVDFYGDFRIGGPLPTVGGFNAHLGFATTNNHQRLYEFYAFAEDSTQPDHYLLDGASHALQQERIEVSYRTAHGTASATQTFYFTPYGPVIHRGNGRVYIVKTAGEGDYRIGEQWLHLMRASTFTEWKAAMRMRAATSSNFTYADGQGTIAYLWNAALPKLPHPLGSDSAAIDVQRVGQMWSDLVPFDSLPLVVNPAGGYVHNENNSPHFTNVRAGIDTSSAYVNIEPPALSLRAQLGLQLVEGDARYSLEDVVARKHTYRVLLADRVKADLIAAVDATHPTGDVAAARALLAQWDNTAAAASKGAVLFDLWWSRYGDGLEGDARFAAPWSSADPLRTPRGLAKPARAVEAFAWAVRETTQRYGALDVTWGAVHRVRRGAVDVPVGGCAGALGCFRTLNFHREGDGTFTANGGDAWVLAVEFDEVPRAYTVLAYGESSRTESPWHADQAAMFARGELKPVAFTAADIERDAVVRYRPGK